MRFVYNADGKRVRKEDSRTGAVTHYYYGNGKLIKETKEYGAVSCDSICGNNLIEWDEVCDSDELNEYTCEDLGYSSGELACSTGCTSFDTTGCS